MLSIYLPSLAALAALAVAAPAPLDIKARDNITSHGLATRSADPLGGPITCGGGPPCVKGGLDTCILNFQITGGAAHAFAVGIPGDTLSNYGEGSSTLGGGLFDNLRGQCGVITDWEAQADDNNNLAARFSTTIFCGSDGVNNAIWLANGKNYDGHCTYTDNS